VSSFELDGGEHAERWVAALTVVEDLEVLEDRVGEFDPGPPAFAVEELDLRVGCSVMSVTHSWSRAVRTNWRSTRSAAVASFGARRHAGRPERSWILARRMSRLTCSWPTVSP
jgi:hypothetical protein